MWRVRHCRDTRAAALRLGMRGRYTERDDESQPNARELLPDDLGRLLSKLAISSLLLSHTPEQLILFTTQLLILCDCGAHLYL
jgi:hypothetical protein